MPENNLGIKLMSLVSSDGARVYMERDTFHAIRALRARFYKVKEICEIMGVSETTVYNVFRSTVEDYPELNTRERVSKYAEFTEEIIKLYKEHHNCDVVRQELEKKGIVIHIKAIQRITKDVREEHAKFIKATRRIESLPGQFMQIDYGTKSVVIGNISTPIKIFCAVLAYSRRIFVIVTPHEKQVDWIYGIEKSFEYFGGKPECIVSDNAKTLVYKPAKKGEKQCELNDTYLSFCRYWNIKPIACYAHYPEAKGKIERVVGYVKNNAFAGHKFKDYKEIEDHLKWWMANVADVRKIDFYDEEEVIPIKRFEKEKSFLYKIDKEPFKVSNDIFRKVSQKGLVRIDNLLYRVPMNLINELIQIRIDYNENKLYIFKDGTLHTTLDKDASIFTTEYIQALDKDGQPTFGTTDARFAMKQEQNDCSSMNDNSVNPLQKYEDAINKT